MVNYCFKYPLFYFSIFTGSGDAEFRWNFPLEFCCNLSRNSIKLCGISYAEFCILFTKFCFHGIPCIGKLQKLNSSEFFMEFRRIFIRQKNSSEFCRAFYRQSFGVLDEKFCQSIIPLFFF